MAFSPPIPMGAAEAANRQKRASVRYRCGPATLGRLFLDDRQEFQRAWVLNLSRTGIGLHLTRPLEVGNALMVHVKANDQSRTYQLAARVMWASCDPQGDWIIGCELNEPLSAEDLEALL